MSKAHCSPEMRYFSQLQASCVLVACQVLVVQEKNGILKNTGLWKMPTGVINQVPCCLHAGFHACEIV